MDAVTRRDALRLTAALAALGGAATADAQEPAGPSRVVDIAFRGGGVEGAAFVGALKVLTDLDPKPHVRRMIGTAAGAIFAAGYAVGLTPAEMTKKLFKNPDRPDDGLAFADFAAEPVSAADRKELTALPKGPARIALGADVVAHLANQDYEGLTALLLRYAPIERIAAPLVKRLARDREPAAAEAGRLAGMLTGLVQVGGACSDQKFRDWMAGVLGPHATKTLGQFHAAVSRDRGQQLSLVATDLTAHELLVLNHRTAPDVPLLEAVRMSMGIPFVWPEVVWKAEWKYNGKVRKTGAEGHRIVDGGVLSNFPLRFFLDPSHSGAAAGTLLGPPPAPPGGAAEAAVRRVGLLLNNAQPADAPEPPRPWFGALPAYQTAARVLDTMMDTWDADALRKLTDDRLRRTVCEIPTKGYSALDFEMSAARLTQLIERGENAMWTFLEPDPKPKS